MATLQTRKHQDRWELYCVVCDTVVLESGRRCPNCRTPIAVSKSVMQRNNRSSRLFSVLGSSGAGKTVYLGVLLDMLSKGTHGMRGIPNGAFSLEVQDQTIAALEKRRFPEKTPSETDRWKWIHCEAFFQRKEKQKIDLITPDVAGEVLAQEIDHKGSCSTINNLTHNSSAILVLLDSTRVRDHSRAEDTFALKLISYIAQQQTREHDERRKHVRLPVAFVLTKTDVCPEAESNTAAFVETNLPGLHEMCKQRFQSYEFFPASVVGTTLEHENQDGSCTHVPLHVQPRGIIEPLQWALGILDKKWRRFM